MQGLTRLVCIGYLIFLTALLLVANPLQWFGMHGNAPGLLRMFMPAAHLLSLLVLAFLALAARWPVPRWAVALLLVLYAGITEIAQGFVPGRTAEWGDWFQDLAGIAAGAVLCWIVATVARTFVKASEKTAPCPSSEMSDDWELLRNVMSRRAVRERSWWG